MYPPTPPHGKVHWVYDDPSGVPDELPAESRLPERLPRERTVRRLRPKAT